MFNKVKIDVKSFVLKRSGIIINKNESISYVIPREIPMEIAYKQIILFSNKTFVLYFKDDIIKKEFLNQIGVKDA